MLNILELEGGKTAMDVLWTGIETVIGKIMPLLGTVTTGLLSNELFQITIGVVVFIIIMSIVFTLLRKVKRRG